MPVSNINDGAASQIILASRNKSRTMDFSTVLRSTASDIDISREQINAGEASERTDTIRAPYIELGRITRETPTVSHILKNHPAFSDRCWDIVFSSINRGKDFTSIPDGTLVALQPGSGEIVWGKSLSSLANETGGTEPGSAAAETGLLQEGSGQPVVIGTISKDSPTVSHLFQANPDFDRNFWNIIHSPLNRDKKYTALPPGTEVLLDTKTMELSFHKKADDNDGKNHRMTLVDAVKPYIGTPYEKIDCYGLLVRGLQNQGIQYRGHGGIREKLEALALRSGLPRNAYFNGEGLVEKAGRKVFSKALYPVTGSQETADEIYSEMMPFLREGFILSFSTPTQGHTGIVARKGAEWTYINSGVIDNQVSQLDLEKGVGEEFLKAELNNWLVLAAEKNESLTVTLGLVENNQS